jgi:hypothetical protein
MAWRTESLRYHSFACRDLLELHELKNSVAYPHHKSNLPPRRTQLLDRVPVGLLPLLSEPSTPPSKPPPKTGSKNTSSTGDAFSLRQPPFLRKPHSPAPPKAGSLASRFSFVPLMPVEDQSTDGQGGEMAQSPIIPQSPANPPTRFEKRFQFVPLLPAESPSSSEPPSDDDHTSPISTPSLTASSSLPSPPGTPSTTSSPSLAPSSTHHLSTPDTDYFNLYRPPTGTKPKPDQSHPTEVDSTFSKLTLDALPSASLVPPSPFDLRGSNAQSKGDILEKLDNSGHLGRKGGKRCVVEYININGVDEPFYSYVEDDERQSPVEKADSPAGLLPPSNGFLPLYE